MDRTKIANESNGKIFLSIHANAHSNRNIQGFETFLLSPERMMTQSKLLQEKIRLSN